MKKKAVFGSIVLSVVLGAALYGGSADFLPDSAFDHSHALFGKILSAFVEDGRVAGLIIDNMWLEVTQYPDPDAQSQLSVLQWIQYQLDLSESVDHVRAHPEEKGGMAPVYGMAATLPVRSIVGDMLERYMDLLYKV